MTNFLRRISEEICRANLLIATTCIICTMLDFFFNCRRWLTPAPIYAQILLAIYYSCLAAVSLAVIDDKDDDEEDEDDEDNQDNQDQQEETSSFRRFHINPDDENIIPVQVLNEEAY